MARAAYSAAVNPAGPDPMMTVLWGFVCTIVLLEISLDTKISNLHNHSMVPILRKDQGHGGANIEGNPIVERNQNTKRKFETQGDRPVVGVPRNIPTNTNIGVDRGGEKEMVFCEQAYAIAQGVVICDKIAR